MTRRDFKRLAWVMAGAAAGVFTSIAARNAKAAARRNAEHGSAVDARMIIGHDEMVPSGDPGISLFVRNKRRKDIGPADHTRTLLFLHGGTQSSEATFDLRLDGFSWMDYIAAQGWDVWLMDLRGFGGSTKPPAMSLPPAEAPPIGRVAEEIADFAAVLEHIRRVRKIPSVNVLTWSWGAVVAMTWAAQHPETIGRLALFGAPWLNEEFPPAIRAIGHSTTPLPGYESWTADDAWKRFKTGIPEGITDDLTPPEWRKVWEKATLATDADAFNHDPPRVRSPIGQVVDMREAVQANRVMYPAGDVQSPVLLATGEWDGLATPTGVLALLRALVRSPETRLAVLGKATHVAHLERRRLELFATVQAFLEGR
jgi:pimeloyl-ACP methyl ester carboxylesterase